MSDRFLPIAKASLTLVSGPIPSPPLELNRAAFLIVDMQHYTTDPNRGLGRFAADRGHSPRFEYYFRETGKAIAVARNVLQAARASGVEVIHLISEGRTVDGRDLSREFQKRGVATPRASDDGQIVPALEPIGDEIVIRKAVSGGFVGTGLDATLRAMRKDTLIVAGVATNQCVESTVRSASNLGYDVVVIADACATYNEEWQTYSLESMADQFATVRSGTSVVFELKRRMNEQPCT